MTWPVGEIEYGSLHWLRREVSIGLGQPPDYALLDQSQRGMVDSVIESGANQFYYPQPGQIEISGATEAQKERLRRAPHSWSFLQKRYLLSMDPGTSSYPLPDDFSGFIDEPNTSGKGRVSIASESHIQQLLSSSPSNGQPRYCAISHEAGDGSAKPTRSLLLYPPPAEAGNLSIRYGIAPPKLTNSHPWPLCGTEHAETLLASCLAVIESRSKEQSEVARARFMERLTSSIMIDMKLATPTTDGVWPEQTQTFGLAYLRSRIGIKAGYGPSVESWTDAQRRKVDEAIASGTRKVVDPPLMPNSNYPHQWSWLSPIASMTTEEGTAIYTLPEDFSSMIGDLTVGGTENQLASPVRRAGEFQLRELIEHDACQGTPTLYAVRYRKEGALNHCELLLHPIPDAEQTLAFRYRRAVNFFTE